MYQKEYQIYKNIILDVILYTIAYYYILLAATNDGFSGFSLGIPYAIFLIWEIKILKIKGYIKNLHILVLIFAIIFVVVDRGRLNIIYPLVDKTYVITKDINYSYDSYHINTLDIFTPYSDVTNQQVFQFNKGDKFHIERQIQTGNADFGINYVYELRADEFPQLTEYIKNNLQQIKASVKEKYYGGIYVNKSRLYYKDKNKFYIGEYTLMRFFKTQGISYNASRLENNFIYFSFYLFVYPVIATIFFLILIYRNRDIFIGKHNKT